MEDTVGIKIYRSVHILIAHILKHEKITGYLPTPGYLIGAFDIPVEFAEYLLGIVDTMQRSEVQP